MTVGVSIALVLVTLTLARERALAQAAPPPAGAPSSAVAASPDDVQRAREAFQVAVSLYAAGRYAEAAREFERSDSLSHEGGLLRNLCLARRAAGDVRGAAQALRAYLEAGAPDTTEDDRRLLEHRLAALDRAIEEEDAAARQREEEARQAETVMVEAEGGSEGGEQETARTTTDVSVTGGDATLAPPSPTPTEPEGDVTREAWFWALLGGGVLVIGGAVAVGIALTTPGPGMDGDVLGRIETLTWSGR